MPDVPQFDPSTVLDLAFADHHFTTTHNNEEIIVQTSPPSHQDEAAYVEVDVMTPSSTDHAATYRYRIEFDGVAE